MEEAVPEELRQLLAAAPPWPRRVVCLTEETTETLYRIGAADRVAGVSGYTVRPPRARREKPRISSFLAADHDRILELRPDLVLAFSDLQAPLAAELVRRGVPVHVFNQRSVAEILQAVRLTCALIGEVEAGEELARDLEQGLAAVARRARRLPRRPRVFFEEWNDPLITGIRWVSELVELAGGEDVFAEKRREPLARGRIVDPEEVARRAPEVVLCSWCGRRASRERILERPGWASVPAVLEDQLYEVPSSEILAPGPAALTDGVQRIAAILEAVARGERLPAPRRSRLRQAPPPGDRFAQ